MEPWHLIVPNPNCVEENLQFFLLAICSNAILLALSSILQFKHSKIVNTRSCWSSWWSYTCSLAMVWYGMMSHRWLSIDIRSICLLEALSESRDKPVLLRADRPSQETVIIGMAARLSMMILSNNAAMPSWPANSVRSHLRLGLILFLRSILPRPV